ncbi:MAG TPA: YicC/YloC family endoribonuclease [Terrimicrobiaceae bacterium]|nr:YicC/YloC family endoribonuclease [Terrimicrobiaceae bacterium]
MKSMTGHGRGTAVARSFRVVAECFSVNRRQCEVALVTSRDLAWLEPGVREEVFKRISRGKVQVSLTVEHPPQSAPVLVDRRRAAEFLREVRALQNELDLAGDISLETVLSAPGVLRTEDTQQGELWPLVRQALGQALEGLLAMRVREGAHLKKELLRAVARMTTRLRRVRALAPRVPKRQRAALFNRLQAARLPVDLLDPRITTEIAVFAERCDITEELARLESHLGQFGDHLESNEPVGRTLEFLAQEMGREWHTAGAKANDAEISLLVVEAKAELDKAREQLANVE